MSWGALPMKKALIFSLDSFIAIITATLLISASFYYLSQVETVNWTQPNLFVTGMDTLTLLRTDNVMSRAIENGSNATLNNFFNNVYPSNLCANLTLHNRTDRLLSARKNCSSDVNDVYVTRRTFVLNHTMHYATLRMWYNE